MVTMMVMQSGLVGVKTLLVLVIVMTHEEKEEPGRR